MSRMSIMNPNTTLYNLVNTYVATNVFNFVCLDSKLNTGKDYAPIAFLGGYEYSPGRL